jgi:hypothetical protein
MALLINVLLDSPKEVIEMTVELSSQKAHRIICEPARTNHSKHIQNMQKYAYHTLRLSSVWRYDKSSQRFLCVNPTATKTTILFEKHKFSKIYGNGISSLSKLFSLTCLYSSGAWPFSRRVFVRRNVRE